ncbi:MAG: molybdopterin-dependent oxidoreductase [Betaproteobacteria bacterium]|nr:molybdopterin-dependent oxidoreductase [Betaproteobacteria bacterium]MDH5343472.1 molybdopterin-dependent oxidoreductase [Betaproteobacteria bacterium]
MAQTNEVAARKLPGSLETNRRLDRWLKINSDGTVTVTPGKVEIGQGILTALVQIVAEELDIDVARIRLAPATTAYSPDEGITSGSRSIQDSGLALRHAAAEVRGLLLEEAARKLDVTLEQLTVTDGVVSARSGGSVPYWELATPELLARESSVDVSAKMPAEHVVVGTSLSRVDIPGKVTGKPSYVQDMKLPGMLHGRVSRPPGPRARLKSLNAKEVEQMPGVVAVVRDGSFLGVVAEREEQAIRAERRLARIAEWTQGEDLPNNDPRNLLKLKAETEVISEKGDASVKGTQQLKAEYTKPYIAHASLAPSCAIAHWVSDAKSGAKVRIWTHSQGIYPLRGDMAQVLGLPESDIVITHAEGAGCYGHNAADDVTLDAVLLARAVPGKPVRLQWMREDEFGWEPFSSPMVMHMSAALDDKGSIVNWGHELWSHAHSTRPGGKGGVNLLAAWHLEKPFPAAKPGNPPLPGGGSHRNAIPLYEFPNQKVTNHLIRESPLRTSALRALGGFANAFAIECFMDELAEAAGADPVEFRLRHLKDARAKAVIEKVVKMAKWQPNEKGDGERGRGVSFARYKNLAAYIAVIAEVRVEEEVRVTRLWGAVDVGQAINPDGVLNQIEGGMIQSASMALKERIDFDSVGVTTRTWNEYPILSFVEVPEIEVALINRPEAPPVGAGEGTQGPVAAAIGNAIYNALGARLRDMPFTRDRIVAALST